MSSVPSTYSLRVLNHHLTKHTLLLAIVASVGLTACSSQQASKPVAKPSKSTMMKKPRRPATLSNTSSASDMKSADPFLVLRGSASPLPSSDLQSPVLPSMVRPEPISAEPEANDNYQKNDANPVHRTTDMAVSTLSIDTDTGSYANVRRYLNEGQLPPVNAVRVEELINYFNYQFDGGKRLGNAPFVVATEVVDSPWDRADQDNKIVKVGIKAVENSWSNKNAKQSMPPANLVFLVDVSGSMSSRDKLPLAQSSLKLLTEQMRAQDSISIVTYSGSTSVALPATNGDQKAKILAAIEGLNASGSTNGEDALKLAYRQAEQAMKKNGINRIMMLTDGDFNVGISDVDDMLDLVKSNRERGISLSTVGFGRGNLNDHMMEQMADNGNGNYSYIDSLTEAKKVFGDELVATFNTVAKDVKVQIEFNPDVVSEWRLIGYENRVLNEQDFNNDKIDAGELGAGKAVIALFEVTPKGQKGLYSDRRYADASAKVSSKQQANELGYLKIRYKAPTGGSSKLVSQPINSSSQTLDKATIDTQFAMAVAGFGQRLSQSDHINNWQYSDSTKIAKSSVAKQPSSDTDGTRRNFVTLTELAGALDNQK
ncbi:von Willebrand factor type A domain-containing protein [Psychrobacter sp. 5A.1]|uniref:vWA domain-containing protein n=1 Tax=Psychrobacter sp. 5A.1 TaxID=3035207 RepID=UPI0025B601A3|nr:von Willebrand factor type A domain-containing protein [Psychrobacter sp. 5A.1]MDN3503765.1 von Willebrand factor type A domain-containing protein [Psychrobacter sp. 5A.1]